MSNCQMSNDLLITFSFNGQNKVNDMCVLLSSSKKRLQSMKSTKFYWDKWFNLVWENFLLKSSLAEARLLQHGLSIMSHSRPSAVRILTELIPELFRNFDRRNQMVLEIFKRSTAICSSDKVDEHQINWHPPRSNIPKHNWTTYVLFIPFFVFRFC